MESLRKLLNKIEIHRNSWNHIVFQFQCYRYYFDTSIFKMPIENLINMFIHLHDVSFLSSICISRFFENPNALFATFWAHFGIVSQFHVKNTDLDVEMKIFANNKHRKMEKMWIHFGSVCWNFARSKKYLSMKRGTKMTHII